MSNLSAFLHPVTTQEEKEIIVSKRFVKRDKDGNPVLDEQGNPIIAPFRIRSLTQEENDALVKQATRRVKINGQPTEQLDSTDFGRRMVVAATIDPDFRSKEACDHFGVLDPLLVPGRMLLSGEYAKLLNAITDLSGFGNAEGEVKN